MEVGPSCIKMIAFSKGSVAKLFRETMTQIPVYKYNEFVT
jgi:hypothetical protein